VGQARYPAFLNRSDEIDWPDGVLDLQLIATEHDLAMVQKLPTDQDEGVR